MTLEKLSLVATLEFYTPKSGGSLFSDTNSISSGDTIINKIINKEVGGYLGLEKSFLRDQLILKGSMRLDKTKILILSQHRQYLGYLILTNTTPYDLPLLLQ